MRAIPPDLEDARLPGKIFSDRVRHPPGNDESAGVEGGLIAVAEGGDSLTPEVRRHFIPKGRADDEIVRIVEIVAPLEMRIVGVGKKDRLREFRTESAQDHE